MTKKKAEPKKPVEHPPGLGDMKTKDLFRSIRDAMAEQAQRSGLEGHENPPKQRRSR